MEIDNNLEINNANFIYCKVYLPTKDCRELKPTEFKVDTGACISSISYECLEKLGYTKEDFKSEKFKEATMIVAGGKQVEVNTTVLPQIKIGENVFHNVKVIVTDKGNLLLGVDVLSAYDIYIPFADKIVKTKFRGLKGEGHIVKPITMNPEDYSAHEVNLHNISIPSIDF